MIRERLKKEMRDQEQYGVQYWPVFLKENLLHSSAPCGSLTGDRDSLPHVSPTSAPVAGFIAPVD